MACHNDFLYTDPDSGLIAWIPWDNNHALSGSEGMRKPLSLSLNEVTDNWPLIRFLMDDPACKAQAAAFEASLQELIDHTIQRQTAVLQN